MQKVILILETWPKFEKPARKVGGEAAHFWCPVFEFWRGGTRSRIVFLEVFARWPLILSDGNKNKSQQLLVVSDPKTDFIRLISSKLLLRAASRRPERPFRVIV